MGHSCLQKMRILSCCIQIITYNIVFYFTLSLRLFSIYMFNVSSIVKVYFLFFTKTSIQIVFLGVGKLSRHNISLVEAV